MGRWLLELQADSGGEMPPEARLRRLLKFAGRACRLKCVGIRPAQAPNENGATVPAKEQGRPVANGVTNHVND